MIGCFKTPSGLFSETLGDFTHEADPDQALMECGELAHNKNYSVFALGFRGLCLSGPDAQDKYYQHKPASKRTKCSNGIGLGPHSVVYSFGMDDFSSCSTSYTVMSMQVFGDGLKTEDYISTVKGNSSFL